MADYPNTVPAFTLLVNNVHDVLAAHQNTPNAEIEAIATDLGAGPNRRILPLAARYQTAAAQSIPGANFTIVDFGTLVYDTHNAVTVGAAWKFTAPVAGYYFVSAAILFAATTTWSDTDYGSLILYVNNAASSYLDRKDSYGSASSVYMRLGGSTVVLLAAASYLDIRLYQVSGGALALLNDDGYNQISIARVGAG